MRKHEITNERTVKKIDYHELKDYFDYMLWYDGIEKFEIYEMTNAQTKTYEVYLLTVEIDSEYVCFADTHQIVTDVKSKLIMFMQNQCVPYLITENNNIFVELDFGKYGYVQIKKS